MASLLVVSSAPATTVGKQLFLDIKFVSGMNLYHNLWNGPVGCMLALHNDVGPFCKIYNAAELPFNLHLLQSNRKITLDDIDRYDVILCSGDSHEYLDLIDICRGAQKKVVYTIEYIAETRRQIISIDPSRNYFRKIYAHLWNMNQERRRRRAFRTADGLQANGYPAFSNYGSFNRNAMIYLDSRVDKNLLATESDVEEREQRLLRGAPLRLLHSGRLEHLKGSHDLIPLARKLVLKRVAFTLDIFGTGSLEQEIRADITRYALQDQVRLHGIVDFESALVPFARRHADIYLSCHRQSDPSCTYIESMGCGLAIIGYDNRMWSALRCEAGAGWVVPLGNIDALANAVFDAETNRDRLAVACRAAWRFAGKHTFESEFRSRIEHLRALAPGGL